MEKTSSGYRTTDLRSRQPMVRRRTEPLYRGDNPTQARASGVLYARRRKDLSSTLITLAIIAIVGIWFFGLFWVGVNSMRSNVARHKNASVVKISTPTPSTAVSARVEGKKKRITNILLLGSDQRAGDNGFRTDVILLVSINQEQGTVSVVSFPRDMWVDAAGLWETKINMVLGMGGFESLAGTFEQNFGVRPDYYLLTNFDGFTGIIDSLEGVDVEVGDSLTDDCDLPQQVVGDCTVEPGTVHMDGATALWYVRSRHTSSDYDRMRRMQEVMAAVFNRLMRTDAMRRIPEMYEAFSSSVETNLGVKEILPLLQVASAVFGDSERIKRYAIAEEYTTEMISWDGMWILLPDLEGIQGMLREAGVE